MTLIPMLLAAVLLVLALAFGLHCLVLHCDRERHVDVRREPDSA